MINQNYFKQDVSEIKPILSKMQTVWDGKNAILEMKEKNYSHWKQMEWMGFYFQFLCENNLQDVLTIPGPAYNNVSFDGVKNIPWDFKAHAINTSSHQIIVNDSEATAQAIKDYCEVGLILALGEVIYNDVKKTFQKWHEKLKGGKSKYEEERIKRGALSRLRKTEFNLKELRFIKINKGTLERCGSFQKNFRNADGSLRRSKVLLDLEKLKDEEVIKRMKF